MILDDDAWAAKVLNLIIRILRFRNCGLGLRRSNQSLELRENLGFPTLYPHFLGASKVRELHLLKEFQ